MGFMPRKVLDMSSGVIGLFCQAKSLKKRYLPLLPINHAAERLMSRAPWNKCLSLILLFPRKRE